VTRAARAYVADVERKTRTARDLNNEYARAGAAKKGSPSQAIREHKHRAFTLLVNRQVAVQKDRKHQTADDAAAYDAMIANRKLAPRKPPPLPENMPTVRSVGSRGLEPQRLRAEAMHWTGEGWRS
jgi:hypothetical protein